MIKIIIFCFLMLLIFIIALIIPEDDYDAYYGADCYDRSLYRCGKCNKRSCRYHKLTKIIDEIENT